MDKKQLEMMAEALAGLSAQKNINTDEVVQYFVEVLVKVFSRDENFDYDNEEMEDGHVSANFNAETGDVSIQRTWTIVEKVEENLKMQQILVGTEEAEELAVGETLVKEINLADLTRGKIQQIKQLMIQRLREAEKEKIYEGFKQYEGMNITAKISHTYPNHYILDYEGTAIFLSKKETLGGDNFKVTELVKIFVSSIDKTSRDAQVVGSRTNPNFVANIIKEEVEDVADGVVKIEGISRIPGFKTKVSVSSTTPEVDPVGAIVGVKGNKIREIMELIKGERVDVIRHNEDMVEFIASALTPSKVKGVRFYEEKNEEKDRIEKKAIAVVEEDEFLSALGKGGRNVKLAVMLTSTNIDIKTVSQAKEEGIEYTEVKDEFISRRSSDITRPDYTDVLESENMSLEDIASTDLDLDIDTLDFEMESYADEPADIIEGITTNEGIEIEAGDDYVEETMEEDFEFDFEEEF